jgi:hypothetical protein
LDAAVREAGILYDDNDDDVYLHRIHAQHKLPPYVKYRPAKKGKSKSKSQTMRSK